MAEKRVLIIAYYFPPLGGAGVQRILKFAKYLPEFGWEPTVLTVKNISYPARDEALLKELPPAIRVVRSGSLDPQRILYLLKRASLFQGEKTGKTGAKSGSGPGWLTRLFFPDSKNGWIPFARMRGRSLLKKQEFDLIFSSSPPVSSHMIAYQLTKITGKPLAGDFRDPWELLSETDSGSWCRRLHERLQKKVLARAKGVVAVNGFMAEDLRKKFNDIRLEMIPNGFDSVDFEGFKPEVTDKFEIVYLGTFNLWNNPNPFLQAFSELVRENREFAEKAQFTRVGFVLNWNWNALLEKYGLDDKNVISLDYVPHRESIKHLLRSKLLLLTAGGKKKSVLHTPGKIYEYLAARKPILAIVPQDGAAAELVRKYKAGTAVDPNDQTGMKKELLSLFERYRENNLGNLPSNSELSQLERRNQTQRLAEFFNRCIGE